MYQFILLLFLLFVAFSNTIAGIINIPMDYPSIQAGINAAVDGDTVLVANGTYFENINFKGKAITVSSLFIIDNDTSHISNTIIDGSQPSHPDSGSVVYFVSNEDTSSVLSGFTITNGTGTLHSFQMMGYEIPGRGGGGIFCFNSGACIRLNKIKNNNINKAGMFYNGGGGIYAVSLANKSAFTIIESNQIKNNTITSTDENNSGGGISMICSGRIVNNVISHNSCITNATASGGGIDCTSDTLGNFRFIIDNNQIINNSIISKYVGEGSGLGLYRAIASVKNNIISYNEISATREAHGAGMQVLEVDDRTTITNNVFSHNVVTEGRGFGGGLSLWNCNASVSKNIISHNSANSSGNGMGGGFFLWQGGEAKIINNTIAYNKAALGGGLNNQGTSPIVKNSIIWDNQAQTDPEIHRTGGSLDITYSNINGGWNGIGNIDADPLFADTTFTLMENSPCIDAGDPYSELDHDGTRADMGAKIFFHLTSPYIWKTAEKIDDSTGNNNGKPDAGESVNISITLINTSLDATGVSAQLLSDDTSLQISQNTASFGDIGRNQVANNESNPFKIQVESGTTSHSTTLYFKITADGDYSNTDSMKVIVGTPDFLIVDDDNGDKYENYYIEPLNAKGIFPDYWDINANGIPEKNLLLQFKAVIWFTGDDRENTLTTGEQSLISDFLDESGRLLITGQNIGYDLVENGTENDSTFYHNYLQSRYLADSSHASMTLGLGNDPITSGMFVFFQPTGGAGNQTSPDIIEPIEPASAILNYTPIMKCAGIRYENANVGSRLVYLAFGIEGISGPNNETAGQLMEKSLNWLIGPISNIKNKIITSMIPNNYNLNQNYPNPFNAHTTIGYQIPKTEHAKLVVYNLLGQTIKILIDKNHQAGSYQLIWDGKDTEGNIVPSGVYFYKLESEGFSQAKKMLLLE